MIEDSIYPAPIVRGKRIETAALTYAVRLGWPVLPLHNIVNGVCSCGNPRCKAAGKHPHIQAWESNATNNSATIIRWWAQWPTANVGIVCGRVSGIVVLDIDPRNGGNDSLYEIVIKHGELPHTPMVQSGGGGTHIYFRYPKNLKIPSRIGLLPGIDVKSDGGFVVLPPSTHISGKRYVWLKEHHPLTTPLADLPVWLLQLIAASQRFNAAKPLEYWNQLLKGVSEGRRNTSITEYTGRLLSHGISGQETLQLMLAWNRRFCHPPLNDEEVIRIVASICNKERSKYVR